MAKLTYEDKIYLEDYLMMGEGYLLDFNNTTLQKFIFESIRIELYHSKYSTFGDSKAKRMRAIWDVESDYIVGRLIKSLTEYYHAKRIVNSSYFNASTELENRCIKISERLLSSGPSPHIESIKPSFDDGDFAKLAESIRTSIENNEPELAIDRLHTFYVKYIRDLCTRNFIDFKPEESLNAIYGKYIKHIETQNILESSMALAIMKYSINLLEKYNDVRNNRSLAHDNKLLNYKESLYIFDTLARLKGFLDFVQERIEHKQKVEESKKQDTAVAWDDLPF